MAAVTPLGCETQVQAQAGQGQKDNRSEPFSRYGAGCQEVKLSQARLQQCFERAKRLSSCILVGEGYLSEIFIGLKKLTA